MCAARFEKTACPDNDRHDNYDNDSYDNSKEKLVTKKYTQLTPADSLRLCCCRYIINIKYQLSTKTKAKKETKK